MYATSPLVFKNLSYSYSGTVALRDISFEICPGKITAIVGPNGSGKSTLVKLGLGILKPDHGEVQLFGQKPTRFRDWSRVGYVPQTISTGANIFFPGTVRELVDGGIGRGWFPWQGKSKTRLLKVDRALDTAGIRALDGVRYRTLSPGQRQRTLLARAIVGEPQLIVLDEPLSAVDTLGKNDFTCLLENINTELQATVVLVSHDIGVLRSHDYACLCINCELVYSGTAGELNDELVSKLYRHPVGVLEHLHD